MPAPIKALRMYKIPLCLCCFLLLGRLVPAQGSFEEEVAAINKLPVAEQIEKFQESLHSSRYSALQKARFYHELGVLYYRQDDLFQAIEQTSRALELRLEQEAEAGEEVVFSAYNLGSFYQLLDDLDQAFAHFQLIIDRAPNSRLDYTFYRLGGLYRQIGEFELSEQAFQQAANSNNFDESELANLWFEWADLYIKQDQPAAARQALPLLTKAYAAYDQLAREDEYYSASAALSLNLMGLAYTYMADYNAAQATFRRALQYNAKCCQDEDLEATINTNQGIAYRRSGQLRKALEAHQNSLQIRSKGAAKDKVQMGMALGCDNLATVLLELGTYEEGLQQVQSALRWALPGFTPQSLMDNPETALLQASPNKNSLLIYLQDKAGLWQQRALAEQRDSYFSNAIETYQLCDRLIDMIREEHLEKNTKLFWRDQARKMYQAAVKAAWIGERPDMAYFFSEKSRAVLLLDGLRELNAHSILPEKTREELARLAARIQYLEKTVYAQPKDEAGKNEGQLLLLRQAYRNLRDSIQQAYPNYYRQKYRPDFIDLYSLQQSLNRDETWVEYFLADDFTLALIISADAIRMVELASQHELDPLIGAFLNNLKNYQQPFDPQPAMALYQYLIAPLDLPPGRHLTLVPDGRLSLLPFEALLGNAPQAGQPYDQWDFLLRQFPIAYAFSANSRFFASTQKSRSNERVLAFAPMALPAPDYGIDEKLELPETRFTVEQLARLLPTDVYLGQTADRNILQQVAPQAAVLHLATHAYLDHEQPEFSYFLVADTDPGKRKFYVNELYNQQYQADLVVLSACETGAGRLFRGEGISSIGKAFAQNGCPNLAMSLWPVDERATGQLLIFFYQKLEAGLPKAEALYQAKMEYLQQPGNEALKHPFRWAGMIYYGADKPLELQAAAGNRRKIWLVLIGIPALFFLWFRRRNSQA